MEIAQKICDKNEWIKLYFLVVSDVKFTIEIHQFENGMKYKMSKCPSQLCWTLLDMSRDIQETPKLANN